MPGYCPLPVINHIRRPGTTPGRLQSITSLKISPGERLQPDIKRKVIKQTCDRQLTANSSLQSLLLVTRKQ
jgi:hypothetical protein